jgi:hypothetical protein
MKLNGHVCRKLFTLCVSPLGVKRISLFDGPSEVSFILTMEAETTSETCLLNKVEDRIYPTSVLLQ